MFKKGNIASISIADRHLFFSIGDSGLSELAHAMHSLKRHNIQHTRKSGENISENGMLISVMLVPEN